MPQTDISEAFLFVTPRSRIFDFTLLVLLGGRLTVLGHNLEKYESSEKLIAYRQQPTQKLKNTEFSYFLFQNLQNFRKFATWNQISKFFNFGQNIFEFGIPLPFKDKNYYPKTKGKEMQTVHQ